jgi:hypothetical protein
LHQSLNFRPGEILEEEGFLSEDVRPGGTYKTLAEQREVLTPAEERFERIRQTLGLVLGPVAFLIMYFLSLPLPRDQHTLTAVLAFTIGLPWRHRLRRPRHFLVPGGLRPGQGHDHPRPRQEVLVPRSLAARGGTLDLQCDYRLRRHRGFHKHPRYGRPDPSLTEPCG